MTFPPRPSHRSCLLATLLLALAACDSGPSGPGGVGAVVEGPGPGVRAAVLELTGPNLYGVDAQPGTLLFQAILPQGAGIRLVLISEGDLPPAFRVHLRDLSDPLPGVTFVELSDPEDRMLPTAEGSRVRFHR